MQSSSNIKSNLLWNSVGNLTYLISQYLLTFITTRLLGFEQAGLFSLAISVGNTVSAIAMYSMRYFQASDLDGEFSAVTYIFSRLTTSIFGLFAALIFLQFTDFSEYYFVCIIIYCIFKCSEAISDVYQGILQLADRMDYIGKAYLLKAFAELMVFTISLIYSKSLLFSFFCLTLCAYFILVAYEIPSSHKVSTFNELQGARIKSVNQLLVSCLPTAIYGILFIAIPYVSRYELQVILGTKALGYYSSVAMPVVIVQVLCQYIFAPLVTPLAAELTEPHGGKFMVYCQRIALSIFAISVASIILAHFLGNPVITFIYGSDISPYIFLLGPLILSTCLYALSQFLGTLLIILRRTWMLAFITLPAFMVSVFTATADIQWWGMNGPTFNFIISLIIFICLAVYLLSRTIRQKSV